ncbi:MAG: hypothetical protein QNJ65_16560 [Xenococcaceae cyanobacterium MO_234.B1]|nr:hypothetical protein [Xenococcaceae cyanobacterium MO_234.B1]
MSPGVRLAVALVMIMGVGREIRLQGKKKTCRKLAYSFWQYLLSRIKGDETVPYLPDVIRARAAAPT